MLSRSSLHDNSVLTKYVDSLPSKQQRKDSKNVMQWKPDVLTLSLAGRKIKTMDLKKFTYKVDLINMNRNSNICQIVIKSESFKISEWIGRMFGGKYRKFAMKRHD